MTLKLDLTTYGNFRSEIRFFSERLNYLTEFRT